jgi:hypothetical protein
MRALKAVVIILGVMIVAATGLVVYGIITKLGNLAGGDNDPLAGSDDDPIEIFRDQVISVAPSAEVLNYVVEENRLVIRMSESEGADRFLIFDLSTGKQMGSIMLEKKVGE